MTSFRAKNISNSALRISASRTPAFRVPCQLINTGFNALTDATRTCDWFVCAKPANNPLRKQMQPARIRKFAKTASDLLSKNSYEAAFVLRWIAYEALVRRAAIKALWMRGAMVSEAQKIINQLQGPEWEDPTSLLAKCCGTYINIEVFNVLRDRMPIRNFLFHQLEVATTKSQFKQTSDILALALDDPSKVFGDIQVHIPGKTLKLGNHIYRSR